MLFATTPAMMEIRNDKIYSMICPPYRASIGSGNVTIISQIFTIINIIVKK